MTTIVFDGRYVAGDRQISGFGRKFTDAVQKVFPCTLHYAEVPIPIVFAAAGDILALPVFIRWYLSDRAHALHKGSGAFPFPNLSNSSTFAVFHTAESQRLNPAFPPEAHGEVFVEQSYDSALVTGLPIYLGSGYDLANGAMAALAYVEEKRPNALKGLIRAQVATEIATHYDQGSAPPVDVFDLVPYTKKSAPHWVQRSKHRPPNVRQIEAVLSEFVGVDPTFPTKA